MKKFLCLLFCILGCMFTAIWIVSYVVLKYKDYIPQSTSILMLANFIIIVLSLIIGCSVINVSIDQWFPKNNSGIMLTKDKVLTAIVVLITMICAGIFVLTILYDNMNFITDESDTMFLRMLMLIMANSYMAYAYYQHFQVVKLIK